MSDRRFKPINSGQFTADVVVKDGKSLTIQDSANTDSLQISQSSTLTLFTSTQGIRFTPADAHDVEVYRSGSNIVTKFYAGSGTDYGSLYHDNNEFFIGSDTAGDDIVFQTGGSTRLTLQGTAYAKFEYPILIPDGSTAPGTASGYASIYVDSSDGDLKVKFGDGTVKTIATDT